MWRLRCHPAFNSCHRSPNNITNRRPSLGLLRHTAGCADPAACPPGHSPGCSSAASGSATCRASGGPGRPPAHDLADPVTEPLGDAFAGLQLGHYAPFAKTGCPDRPPATPGPPTEQPLRSNTSRAPVWEPGCSLYGQPPRGSGRANPRRLTARVRCRRHGGMPITPYGPSARTHRRTPAPARHLDRGAHGQSGHDERTHPERLRFRTEDHRHHPAFKRRRPLHIGQFARALYHLLQQALPELRMGD